MIPKKITAAEELADRFQEPRHQHALLTHWGQLIVRGSACDQSVWTEIAKEILLIKDLDKILAEHHREQHAAATAKAEVAPEAREKAWGIWVMDSPNLGPYWLPRNRLGFATNGDAPFRTTEAIARNLAAYVHRHRWRHEKNVEPKPFEDDLPLQDPLGP